MVDCHLKAFLDRSWGIAHRPSLKGKYGFVTATGGGPLEAEASWYLQSVLNVFGARSIAALTQSAADSPAFATSVRRTVEDLDRALDEKWQIAGRFGTRGTAWTFRDLVATSGMILRADYEFHKEHRLTATNQARIAKAREERLAAYLRRGRLGEGKEISS
jgi:hypothetical protein